MNAHRFPQALLVYIFAAIFLGLPSQAQPTWSLLQPAPRYGHRRADAPGREVDARVG